MRAALGLALVTSLATGCVSQSHVGPYVKTIARMGPVLRVQKCVIVLTGNTLEEGECSVEDIPIASLPTQLGPPMQ